MASSRRVVERLRGIPLFSELSGTALAEVARTAKEVAFEPGQLLIEPNQKGTGLFVIEEGTVNVDARRRKTKLGAGDFVGELALLNSTSQRTARVRAETPVRCFAIERRDFARLLEQNPRIALTMLRTLAERLEQATA